MIAFLLARLLVPALCAQAHADPIPPDFPTFAAPGRERELDSLRALYFRHYADATPKATLWDGWLASPALWPAVAGTSDAMRAAWREALLAREIEPDGYVATHQHPSIAHPHGWPFPFWNQGQGGAGWHFSFADTIGPPWRKDSLDAPAGFALEGATDGGVEAAGWRLSVAGPASIVSPPIALDTFQSPFFQVRASCATKLECALDWIHDAGEAFSPAKSVAFAIEPGAPNQMRHVAIPMAPHAQWRGNVVRLRLRVKPSVAAGTSLVLQALFSQYDTRHSINDACFIEGCADFFHWTGDAQFLQLAMPRLRAALEFLLGDQGLEGEGIVVTKWVGHDGVSGISLGADGAKSIASGHGIGGNYWDLLPFGNQDAYATIRAHDAVAALALLEREVAANPQWAIPPPRRDADFLEGLAARVAASFRARFWSEATGRFVGCIDVDGRPHDYGFTFVNLEAIAGGLASPAQAASIVDWIAGDRAVDGDTSTGADVYRWRFAPRATTRRNVDWYGWYWSAPESIPFGGQVQDGGAVLGFSHHDVTARLATRGADDAWARLAAIAGWYDEVRAAGGYRAYYAGRAGETLQGCGTPGGLGADCEFFESVMAPQSLLTGFLGFAPRADGFALAPRLPAAFAELRVSPIRFQDRTLAIRATRDAIEIETLQGAQERTLFVALDAPVSSVVEVDADGTQKDRPPRTRARDGALEVRSRAACRIRLALR